MRVDRNGQHVRRSQPSQMIVNGGRLPASVCEDSTVGHWTDDAAPGISASVVDCTPAPRLSTRRPIVVSEAQRSAARDDRDVACSSCCLPDVGGLRLQFVKVGDGALRMRGRCEDEALLIGQNVQ